MTNKIDTKIITYGAFGLGIMLLGGGVIYYFKKSSNQTNQANHDDRSNSNDSTNSNDFNTLRSMGYTEQEAKKKINGDELDESSWDGGSKKRKKTKKKNKKRTNMTKNITKK